MTGHFEKQHVLVTGASSGIGRALAERVAAEGGNLVLVARRAPVLRAQGEELEARYGVRVDVVPADLSLPGAAAGIVQELSARGITVDALVNNAGLGVHGDLVGARLADVSAQVAVNITALTELTALLLPAMVARGRGAIVNVASTAAFQPVPHMAVYAATKAYVLSFSRALWSETRGTGVRVLVVSPGATDTAFFDVAGDDASVGRRRTPEQVVDVAMSALRADRREVVDGAGNALLARAASRLPTRWAIALAERSVRPQPSTTATITN
ncbi:MULTISPECIES: SDR family NAD(P)-dependent oxidoreductase [unclassified Nocardioides]|uniref:SDR family NAD(P)-dependent oxidoreductase n=1 Tax=unclassified Nocardioides TaxID=2615069 RepID=UPI0006FC7B69|nr:MULTISPECIES: SDR family oxidoreductase [unclassified Nocardioides]KRA30955.1 oxidoreductase [Nocardioides sp. Root614]KRA87576.1 oxidoreductase [Nocardioides sp. Root682]